VDVNYEWLMNAGSIVNVLQKTSTRFGLQSGVNLNVAAKQYIGSATTTPTALLHIGAGTTGASTAPLKFTSGSLMTTAESGGVEFLTDKFYGTITTGAARKEFTLNDAALTSGQIPVATTNGRLTDLAAGTSGQVLTSSGAGTAPTWTDKTLDAITGGIEVKQTQSSGSTTHKTYETLWIDAAGTSVTQDINIMNGYTDATATIIFTVVGVKSDGSESTGAQYAATFNKDGGTTVVEVGSESELYMHETDAASSVTISVASNLIRVVVDSGDADSYRWTVFAKVTITQL